MRTPPGDEEEPARLGTSGFEAAEDLFRLPLVAEEDVGQAQRLANGLGPVAKGASEGPGAEPAAFGPEVA